MIQESFYLDGEKGFWRKEIQIFAALQLMTCDNL